MFRFSFLLSIQLFLVMSNVFAAAGSDTPSSAAPSADRRSTSPSAEREVCGICLGEMIDAESVKSFWCSFIVHKECFDDSCRSNERYKDECMVCRLPKISLEVSAESKELLHQLVRISSDDAQRFVETSRAELAGLRDLAGHGALWLSLRLGKFDIFNCLLQESFSLQHLDMLSALMPRASADQELPIVFNMLVEQVMRDNPSATPAAARNRAARFLFEPQIDGMLPLYCLCKKEAITLMLTIKDLVGDDLFIQELCRDSVNDFSPLSAALSSHRLCLELSMRLNCNNTDRVFKVVVSSGRSFGADLARINRPLFLLKYFHTRTCDCPHSREARTTLLEQAISAGIDIDADIERFRGAALFGSLFS